ncbi:MAG TPA: hypothetical protein VHN18_14400 [Micromonosporaceae bacterium]|nr:hypothetical protein [Micromonosporaceae bacterium]
MDRNDRDERKGGADNDRGDRGTQENGDEGRIPELPDEDVQVGPELTDRPRAGSTEPPD